MESLDDVAQYEKAYITHGIRVWTEWEQHCHQAGISPHAPQDSALVLQVWIRAREAATGYLATYNAMKWLLSTLRVPLILDQVARPKKKATAKEDRGQVQAIVAETGMLVGLKKLDNQLYREGVWRCAILVVHMSSP